MSEKAISTLSRLVQKLSALRQTLEDDERVILDQMVTAAQPEVVMHEMKPGVDPAFHPAAEPKLDLELGAGAVDDEVTLHALEPALEPMLDPAAKPKLDLELGAGAVDDEVTLHAMHPSADPMLDPAAKPKVDLGTAPGRVKPRIAVDPNGNYIIKD